MRTSALLPFDEIISQGPNSGNPHGGKRELLVHSPKRDNAYSVRKIVKGIGANIKSEKSCSNSEELSVMKEPKSEVGEIPNKPQGASGDKNSANKTVYAMQHQQSPPEQIAYMNGFRVPESPQIHNILKKINALRSPYLGNAVSGSKMESPRMMQFAKGGIRSGNSYKQFESGSPTNEHGMLNYYPSSHYPGFVPAYPVHAFEDSGYHGSQQAMRAALYERELLHSRYPYRPIREPSILAELHGQYSLL